MAPGGRLLSAASPTALSRVGVAFASSASRLRISSMLCLAASWTHDTAIIRHCHPKAVTAQGRGGSRVGARAVVACGLATVQPRWRAGPKSGSKSSGITTFSKGTRIGKAW
eukprot:scaffold39787_cov65-Phaeocystis_antarctica.AAC.5